MHGTLANFLLNLTVRAGSDGQRRNTFRLQVRREDLADHLGLTLADLEAEFERLIALGVISVTAHDFVTVLDQPGLEMQRLRRSECRVDERHASPAEDSSGEDGIERDAVEAALARILADERFVAAPRSADLLAYLVRKTLDGEAHRLDASRIAVEALGKQPGFRPHLDPNLNAPLERLGRMLETYHASEPEVEVGIHLAIGTYRVIFERGTAAHRPGTIRGERSRDPVKARRAWRRQTK